MALSYLTENEAPRDFRISTTESESQYTKCPLCHTEKKNFYCVDCIKTGNFLHSSFPYSDRFADKQAKLLRLEANRRHVHDRCEVLLTKKLNVNSLQTEVKQCRNKIEYIKMAIKQRRNKIKEKQEDLFSLKLYNTELNQKMTRYQKRVLGLETHVHERKIELEKIVTSYSKSAESLSSLRRAKIRQLTKYIFPVYITYDTSDSIEDMEFLQLEEAPAPPPPCRERLHFVAAWLPADGDYSQLHSWLSQSRSPMPVEAGAGGWPPETVMTATTATAATAAAALALAAQLATLLAAVTDTPLPYHLSLREYNASLTHATQVCRLARAVAAATARLALRAGRAPPPPPAPPARALTLLHDLAIAANTDDVALGRVSTYMPSSLAALGVAWEAHPEPAEPEPEHLVWTDTLQMEELSSTPPVAPPPASLVTSAAASLASFLRGWAK